MTFPQSIRSSWISPLLLLLWTVAGCGYMVGAPYQAHIQSVHVPIFSSKSFRRGIEFELTDDESAALKSSADSVQELIDVMANAAS